MRIKITNAKIYKEGNYDRLLLGFERDGKNQERKLARVGNNIKAYDALKNAEPGQEYDVKLQKNGQFWDWVDIVAAGESNNSETTGSMGNTKAAQTYTSRSGFETPEERARKQVYIIRQSSLSNAVDLLGPKAKIEDVFNVAERMVDFVLGNNDEAKQPEFD